MLQDYPNVAAMLGELSSKHPLVKIDGFRPDFMTYCDSLLAQADEILKRLNVTPEQRKTLKDKLRDGRNFFATLTEVETLLHLDAAGFSIQIEPLFPLSGPDFLVADQTFRSYVEVRSLGPEEHELDSQLKFEYIRTKYQKVESQYAMFFSVPDAYGTDLSALKDAVNTSIRLLREIEQSGKEHATLYYFGKGDYHLSDHNLMLDPFALNWTEGEAEIQARCLAHGTLSVDYKRSFDQPGTERVAFIPDARWLAPLPRVRSTLNSKISQLVEDHRNVIVLDISHANVREEEVEEALYGSVRTDVVLDDRQILGIEQRRTNNGFFKNTTRVKAVVAMRRVPDGESMRTHWTVFPSSNPTSALLFTKSELQRFGELARGSDGLASKAVE